MPSSRNKVRSGDPWKPPPAELHNTLVDLASLHQAEPGGPTQHRPPSQHVDIEIFSTTAVAPGTVVGWADPINVVDDNEASQEEAVANKADPSVGRWAIAKEGIGQDEHAECVLVGLAWAEVNVTDETHEWADIDGTTLASQNSGYAKIRFKPSGTGSKWCLLQLGFNVSAPDNSGVCKVLEFLSNPQVVDQEAIFRDATVGPEFEELTNEQRLAELKIECKCFVQCGLCENGEMPATVFVELSGFALSPVAATGYHGTQQTIDDFATFVNQKHTFTKIEGFDICSTTLSQDAPGNDPDPAFDGTYSITLSRSPAFDPGWLLEIRFSAIGMQDHVTSIQGGVMHKANCTEMPISPTPANSTFDIFGITFTPGSVRISI